LEIHKGLDLSTNPVVMVWAEPSEVAPPSTDDIDTLAAMFLSIEAKYPDERSVALLCRMAWTAARIQTIENKPGDPPAFHEANQRYPRCPVQFGDASAPGKYGVPIKIAGTFDPADHTITVGEVPEPKFRECAWLSSAAFSTVDQHFLTTAAAREVWEATIK